MTSAGACKDYSISRTGDDLLNMENDISMNDPGNGVFSTIPPHKLACMGRHPSQLLVDLEVTEENLQQSQFTETLSVW